MEFNAKAPTSGKLEFRFEPDRFQVCCRSADGPLAERTGRSPQGLTGADGPLATGSLDHDHDGREDSRIAGMLSLAACIMIGGLESFEPLYKHRSRRVDPRTLSGFPRCIVSHDSAQYSKAKPSSPDHAAESGTDLLAVNRNPERRALNPMAILHGFPRPGISGLPKRTHCGFGRPGWTMLSPEPGVSPWHGQDCLQVVMVTVLEPESDSA